MNEPKLTPWFPISTPPVREGVYNVSCRSSNQSGIWYSYFNGKYFSRVWDICALPKSSYGGQDKFDEDTKSWRGIAK